MNGGWEWGRGPEGENAKGQRDENSVFSCVCTIVMHAFVS